MASAVKHQTPQLAKDKIIKAHQDGKRGMWVLPYKDFSFEW